MKIGIIHVRINGDEESLMSTDQYAEVTYDDIVALAGKTPGDDYLITYSNPFIGSGMLLAGGKTVLFEGARVYVYPQP